MTWKNRGKQWLAELLLAMARYLNFDAQRTNRAAEWLARLGYTLKPREQNK